jgi:hypothetical protein
MASELGRICAIDAANRVHCWSREFGDSPMTEEVLPIEARNITIGSNTTCVENLKGESLCWGEHVATREQPHVFGRVSQTRAGTDHVCVLRNSGEIECIGDARRPPHKRLRSLSFPGELNSYCAIAIDGNGYCWGNPSRSRGLVAPDI